MFEIIRRFNLEPEDIVDSSYTSGGTNNSVSGIRWARGAGPPEIIRLRELS